ncbi:MAG: hypothetical protein NTX61_06390 [Bacteroidetes bacterium]|nr:hypothetical protein [Bacteroidota bacterium]
MTFNKDEVSIYSACDVDSTLLIDFYRKVYPNRLNSLELNWKWLNRSDFYENKIPLVLVYKNQVLAQSGMIPFNISMCGDLQTASWFIDFIILPEFQKHGLGSILTKEWMTFSDCFVTFCNEKSIGVFKKFGWIESFDTYMHLNFMLPFKHPGFDGILPAFIRSIFNYISYPVFFLIYSRHSYSNASYHLEKLNEESFNAFFHLYTKTKVISENTVSPIRDMEYAKWRVLNSPNKDKYFIYKTEKFSALVSLNNNHGEYIDILWVSDINEKIEIKKLISTLGIYGIKNGFSYIRFYTSKKELSDYIKNKTKSIVRHPRFAYFSKVESILEKLKSANWDFELIDSDFEHVK